MAKFENRVIVGRGPIVEVLGAISTLSDEIRDADGEQCVQLSRRLETLFSQIKACESDQQQTPKEAIDEFLGALRRTLTFVTYCRSTQRGNRVTTYVNGELRLLNRKVNVVETLLRGNKLVDPVAKLLGPIPVVTTCYDEDYDNSLQFFGEHEVRSPGRERTQHKNSAHSDTTNSFLRSLERASVLAKRDAIQNGGVKTLLTIISSGDASQREQAREAVQILSKSLATLALFARAGGIALLMDLLHEGSATQQCHAVHRLTTLTTMDEFYEEMATRQVEESLVLLAKIGTAEYVRVSARGAVIAVQALRQRKPLG